MVTGYKVKIILIIAVVLTISIGLWNNNEDVAENNHMLGEYSYVSALTKHSKAQVRLEVFINFSCPHCYHSHRRLKTLIEKYKDHLSVIYHPIVPNNLPNDVLRLFYIARKSGKELQAIELFYQAKFEQELTLEDPQVITLLAKKLNLSKEYSQNKEADWINNLIRNDKSRVKSYNIHATPSWVIEQQLNVKTNFKNLELVINNLLKN